MKPCFGYIRVSTQKQGEGVSLEAQKSAIAAFASQNDLTVIKWFEEKETAAKTGRPLFGQMLRQLKQGKATGLIMHKIDRSARNLRDWALISELPKYGVKPYFAADGLDFETRGGRLSANLQAVIAEDFIFNLREETIKGMNGRLKQGLFPWKAPPGYLDCGGGKPKVPCPKVAPLIRLLYDLYASGQHSYMTLLEEMHRQGLRNVRGGQLTLCGLGNILQNPFYIGLIHIKRSSRTYQGVHEPIISPTTWQRVQYLRTRRSGPKATRHHHQFQGLFRCGLCDGPMVPEKQKGHIYYRCKHRTCPTKTIREEVLETAIVTALEALTPSPGSIDKVALAESPADTAKADELRRSLDLRINDEQRRLDRAEDLLIDGTISDETYGRKCRAIKIRLASLQEEARNLPDTGQKVRHQRQLAELRNSLILLYKLSNRAEKRLIIENVWPNRSVIRNEPVFEPYNWILEGQNSVSLLGGAPERDTRRTSQPIVQGDMSLIQPLFDLLNRLTSGPNKSPELRSWLLASE